MEREEKAQWTKGKGLIMGSVIKNPNSQSRRSKGSGQSLSRQKYKESYSYTLGPETPASPRKPCRIC